MVFAFCRTAPSVRFKAFATSAAGVFDFECALSARTSSFVQEARPEVFFLAINFRSFCLRSIVPSWRVTIGQRKPRGEALVAYCSWPRALRTLRERGAWSRTPTNIFQWKLVGVTLSNFRSLTASSEAELPFREI
jgi:hypothetical protein